MGIDRLKQRQENCEDEEEKGRLSERIAGLEAKLKDQEELQTSCWEMPPRDERKATLEERIQKMKELAEAAREAGKEKKADRMDKKASQLQKWLDEFEEESSCPSDCESCIDCSPSDCSDACNSDCGEPAEE